MMSNVSRRFWDLLWRLWYPLITRLAGDASITFLNYGYADDGAAGSTPRLDALDEPDRPCIQLYHRVVSAADLQGCDVLEVSCGHGGGASYLARYLHPRRLHGLDRNARAIALCRRRHQAPGLSFSRGNALALPFDDNAFDAVVNIEASHCYPDVPRFLSEVRRVLRPGGAFLYADFRGGDRATLQRQLDESGLETVRCDDISRQVLRGMQLNTPKYRELIRHRVPNFLQKPAGAFAGIEGSVIYKSLESRETVYLCFHLRKLA